MPFCSVPLLCNLSHNGCPEWLMKPIEAACLTDLFADSGAAAEGQMSARSRQARPRSPPPG